MQSICNVLIMSVTCFSLSVTALRFFYIKKEKGENGFGKHDEWTGKTNIIRQNYGNLPGSWRSMHSYTLTYSRF